MNKILSAIINIIRRRSIKANKDKIILRNVKMSAETLGLLSILIYQIQKANPNEEIKQITDSWVIANNLHPELVRTSIDDPATIEHLETFA